MNNAVRLIITILFGWSGVHRFIDKKIGTGILYLFTFGLFGVGWIVDIVSAIKTCADIRIKSDSANEVYFVAGVYYHKDDVNSLAKENWRYKLSPEKIIRDGKAGTKIYQYYFNNSPVMLVPEPDNEYDSCAIAVLIDGIKVGYIPSDENEHLLKKIKSGKVGSVSAEIYGGNYKVVSEDGHEELYRKEITIKLTVSYVK